MEAWYLGAQNDALFIIDKPPRPSNDNPVHEWGVEPIGKVYDVDRDAEETLRRGRLLAAAPELLAALRRLLEAEKLMPFGLPVDAPESVELIAAMDQAWDAVAKATGDPSPWSQSKPGVARAGGAETRRPVDE